MKVVLCQTDDKLDTAISEELEKRGCEVFFFTDDMTDKDYDKEYLQRLTDYITEKLPEMLWSIEYLPIVARACKSTGIPYISWSVRESWETFYSETISYQTNLIFISDESIAGKFYHKNPGHIYYLPLGVAVSEVEEEPKTVALCSKNPEYSSYYIKGECPEYLGGYIQGLVEIQKRVYGYHFIPEVLRGKRASELGKLLSGQVRGKDYRKKPVKELMDDFFCDMITKEEREEAEAFLKEMNIFYQGEKIATVNLNITARKWKTGVPYDMLQVMGQGGFVLTNYQRGMEEFFTIGEDFAVYEDKQDMQKKIFYYLEHEEERKRIAFNGKKKVEELYKLEQRINDIFYVLREV